MDEFVSSSKSNNSSIKPALLCFALMFIPIKSAQSGNKTNITGDYGNDTFIQQSHLSDWDTTYPPFPVDDNSKPKLREFAIIPDDKIRIVCDKKRLKDNDSIDRLKQLHDNKYKSELHRPTRVPYTRMYM